MFGFPVVEQDAIFGLFYLCDKMNVTFMSLPGRTKVPHYVPSGSH